MRSRQEIIYGKVVGVAECDHEKRRKESDREGARKLAFKKKGKVIRHPLLTSLATEGRRTL